MIPEQKSIFIDTSVFYDPNHADYAQQGLFVTTPEAFVDSITLSLGRVSKSETGKALINSVDYHCKRRNQMVHIKPFMPLKSSDNACNSVIGSGDSNADPRIDLLSRIFRGKGIGAVIGLTPGRYDPSHSCSKKRVSTGQYSVSVDEVLFHELVHAFRIVSGKYVARKGDPARQVSGGMTLYDNFEEFVATMITCIYQSDMGLNIRSSHHGHYKMDSDFDTSLEFFRLSNQSFPMVKRFCTEHPGLSRLLSKMDIGFNPVRAYVRDPNKAQQNSKSTLANWRDTGPFGPLSDGNWFLSWDLWKDFLH